MEMYYRGWKVPQWLTKLIFKRMMRQQQRRMAAEHGGPLRLGQEFLISEGGDGDQSFLGKPQRMRLVETNWQCSAIAHWGTAILLRIESGEYDRQYVALTSSPAYDIHAIIEQYGSSGCVVHLIGSESDKIAGIPIKQGLGKSYVQRTSR